MTLRHRGNVQPTISLEEHGHAGDSDDGPAYKRIEETLYQTKIVSSGGYTYICRSLVGTSEATAGWQIKRIDAAGSTMFADADTKYDNIATDPTSLSYSYS